MSQNTENGETVVRVVVFGATGKTGRHVIDAGLAAGHQIVAFGRSVDRLDISNEALELRKGDVFDQQSVSAAIAGCEAAIVCLGSTGLRDKTTLAGGTQVIVEAMAEADGDRLVVLSAIGVGESWGQTPWSSKLVFRTLLRNVLADHHRQEAIVENSSLNWTIVRAAVLKDESATGSIIASNDRGTTRINRADVADFLVDQLADETHERQAISISA